MNDDSSIVGRKPSPPCKVCGMPDGNVAHDCGSKGEPIYPECSGKCDGCGRYTDGTFDRWTRDKIGQYFHFEMFPDGPDWVRCPGKHGDHPLRPRRVTGFGFHKWWDETGRFIGPESGVSWEDFRKDFAEMAFEAGMQIGLARAGNYTANDATCPTCFTFANGTRVTCVNNVLFLERGVKP